MVKYYFIIKDIVSDIMGGSGILLSITTIIDGSINFMKLLSSIGGVVLVYYSVKLKIELLKEKKEAIQKEKEDEKIEL